MRALAFVLLSLAPAARASDTIVLWALPEAQAKLGPEGLEAVSAAANGWLAALGVKTKLVVHTGKSLTRAQADAYGKLAILGNKKNVLALGKASGLLPASDADWLERTWEPSGRNPEKSDFSASGDGKYSVLGLDACYSFAAESGVLTPAQAAALFALHGVGHQAGMSHPKSEDFNDDGARLLSMLNGKLYVSDMVGVQLTKRPPARLFDAGKFSTAMNRDDVDPAYQKTQRSKWLAAFAAR